ncbi:MAG TPA: PAS domain-containing protein [Myxococcaceae bacterium]|nr:PAS domain-containing protein [Myxococcaceae bacterium]
MPEQPSSSLVLPVPWEDFFSHAPLPMGVLARKGEDARFLEANTASAAQLGKEPSQVAGRTALELGIPPALVQGWLMALEAVHQLGKPLDVRWQLSTDHGLRTFTSRVLPFPDREASTQHFGHITQDWTGARDVSIDDAAERERLAGGLAAALAEEIEAPLEQLLGLIGIVADEVGALADTDPTLELEECGRVLASAMLLARRAHLPIHELREFLRPVPYSPGPVDAGDCMRSALRLVSSQVKRSCGIRTEILPATLVQADEPRLRHALVRVLLETARGPGTAHARLGDLVLSMTRDVSVLELVITRTDRCPLPQGDLGTCERLVREAGGLLRVESGVGPGFRVRIALPLVHLRG